MEFSWGQKGRLGGKNYDVQYYKSFTYDRVEYFLYDSVYMWGEGQSEPHIGKLVKIYETPHLDKMVQVVWYFRSKDVQSWLNGTPSLRNELFLASGEGPGLINDNHLQAISGKCNVVCTSKDKRNPQASKEELEMSNYIFYRTFDVDNCRLSERFPDQIAGVEVRHYFNRRKYVEPDTHPVAGKSNSSFKFETDNASTVRKDEHLRRGNFTDKKVLKLPAATFYQVKKRKLHDVEVENGKNVEADSGFIELKKRPKVDSRDWFKKQPWDEKRMQKAHETGSLVLLENLDPSVTSLQVEDIIWDAFNKRTSAKMIQCNMVSSPYNGQALVIFNSKDEADFAISELKTKCLMLGDARPVVGSRPSLKEVGKPSNRFGHITIDNMRQKQRMEMRNAVSTSHYSQPNTIVFDMAVEWRALQMRSKLYWDALHKQQAKEIGRLKSQLKSR